MLMARHPSSSPQGETSGIGDLGVSACELQGDNAFERLLENHFNFFSRDLPVKSKISTDFTSIGKIKDLEDCERYPLP